MNRNRKNLLTVAGIATAAVMALGCSGLDDDAAQTGTTNNTAAPAGSVAAKADNKPARFGKDSKTIDGGLVITTAVPKLFTPSDTSAGHVKGNKAFYVKVTIENKTGKTVDLNLVTFDATLGKDGTTADTVIDSAKNIGGGFDGMLGVGKKKTATVGFTAPTKDVSACTLEVNVGFEGQTADFEGAPAK